MALFDTCALLWTTLSPQDLTKKEFNIATERLNSQAFISSITIWEIGIKIKKGKLDIKMSVGQFVRMLKGLGTLTIIPVDEKIWMENLRLDWENRDPADRTIVATAILNDLEIVTKDKIMEKFYPRNIW